MSLRCPSQIVALLVFKVKETTIHKLICVVFDNTFGWNQVGLLYFTYFL